MMNRPLIFLAAAASAALAVTSACLAEVRGSDRPFRADDLHFTLTAKDRAPGKTAFRLFQGGGKHNGSYDDSRSLADLGLAADALDRDGPISLAMVREPGRIDCRGIVRDHAAHGDCRFTADAGFNQAMTHAGIKAPTVEDSYVMTLVGVTRSLVNAIGDARYGPADAGDLTAMAAVGVSPAYIQELASRGYRPTEVDDLVAFKAVGVTPAYVDGLLKAGVTKTDGETIVAMRALDITPEFVRGFARIGYPNLDPDKLVELKALGVTPEMVQAMERDRSALSLPQREAARTLIANRRR